MWIKMIPVRRKGFQLSAFIFSLIILSASLVFSQEKQSQDIQPAEKREKEYAIGIGDVIEVLVWKEPDLSRTVPVRLDGRISLPLVGDVKAAGMTTSQLTKELKDKLSGIITEPTVNVLITESRSMKYFITGEINTPGEFAIEKPITVLQALARGGGFREWAKKNRILIVRRLDGEDRYLPFDYEAFLKDGTSKQNILIEPGDTIIVP